MYLIAIKLIEFICANTADDWSKFCVSVRTISLVILPLNLMWVLQHLFWCTRGFFYYLYNRVTSANMRIIWLLIEFTSRFAGKVYPYARIEQRKYVKSPEGLTKSVRSSGLFFLPGRCIQNCYTKQRNRRRANEKKKYALCARTTRVNQNWFTILDQTRKSESVLIHSHTSPKSAPCGADAPRRTRTRWTPQTHRLARLWGCGAAWAVQLNTGE